MTWEWVSVSRSGELQVREDRGLDDLVEEFTNDDGDDLMSEFKSFTHRRTHDDMVFT